MKNKVWLCLWKRKPRKMKGGSGTLSGILTLTSPYNSFLGPLPFTPLVPASLLSPSAAFKIEQGAISLFTTFSTISSRLRSGASSTPWDLIPSRFGQTLSARRRKRGHPDLCLSTPEQHCHQWQKQLSEVAKQRIPVSCLLRSVCPISS